MKLLVTKAKKHDKDAFSKLIEQQEKAMYQMAKSILRNEEDVADAIQETIMICWEKIHTLKKDKYFKTWLLRILINNCNRILKQRMQSIEECVSEIGNQESGYETIEWKEFLDCLDEKYRIVIMLYYVQGFNGREIAEILQLNESTVRRRLMTARNKLEKQYNDHGKSSQTRRPDRKAESYLIERGVTNEQI